MVVTKCSQHGIKVAGVTKVFCGQELIAYAMKDGGVDILADSRIENLKRLHSIHLPKMLLRIPMISEVGRVIENADISMNSELNTLRALSAEARKRDRVHKVILMMDLGDLREGIFDDAEMFHVVEEVIRLDCLRLVGVGANFTCFGGVLPTIQNLAKLVECKHRLEEHFNIYIDIVSGGNSSSFYLLERNIMPDGINQLRLGEAILLGRETAFGRSIQGTYDDCIKLVVEIVEIKEKPSLPQGELGLDAFGRQPAYVDKGVRKRAICAIGKQDVIPDNIAPEDKFVAILGASSDHLILDVSDSDQTYKIGGEVSFKLLYGGILSCMTSEYVNKIYVD